MLQRETDAVSQQIKEDMQRLQSDIQVRPCAVLGIAVVGFRC